MSHLEAALSASAVIAAARIVFVDAMRLPQLIALLSEYASQAQEQGK